LAGFVGWTADSRYAIYFVDDQYGNSAGLVFDTTAWKQLGLPQYVGLGDMAGRFPDRPVAVGTLTARILLRLGRIIILPGSAGPQLLEGTGQKLIVAAAWSPDETHLAFVALTDSDAQTGTVFLAAADGRDVRAVATVPIADWRDMHAGWAGADQATVTVGGTCWTFDAKSQKALES
jgi:hypothetical protein